MSRKLIHSIRALTVTIGLFAVGLAIGIPASLHTAPGATASQIEASEISSAVVSTPQTGAVKPAPNKPHQRRRRARDEMALPFFSFAHVLRRGNGS